MPRTSRVVVPNVAHHVVARGVDRMRIFRNGFEKGRYLKRVALIAAETGVQIHAYSLMENHVHFVLTPTTAAGLGKFCSRLHTWWAMRFNRKFDRTGHLFQSRFHSSPLSENHCWNALRYVELNAVRAGLVRRAEEWPWSSARDHLRLRTNAPVPLVRVNTRSLPPGNWEDLLAQHLLPEDETIRRAHRGNKPCGSSEFVRRINQQYRPNTKALVA